MTHMQLLDLDEAAIIYKLLNDPRVQEIAKTLPLAQRDDYNSAVIHLKRSIAKRVAHERHWGTKRAGDVTRIWYCEPGDYRKEYCDKCPDNPANTAHVEPEAPR